MTATVRVAAAQLAAGVDLDENLGACLAAIDTAADRDARLVVLPEFCNHLSWYQDAEHCWRVAVPLGGPWLDAISTQARFRRLFVVVNATVRRGGGACSATSLLYGPDGVCLATADKQVLIGHENDFLRRATAPSPIVETPLGRLGLYACMDGVIAETARGLALRGADILCNSLNSFALDEASLHVPVRAAENRVFVIAANKVGPLIPAAMLGPVSAATSIPERFLHGAGESQIVAPSGQPMVLASRDDVEVVVADITPARARNKRRPDGTDVFANRRPGLYAALAADPATPAGATQTVDSADRLEVAALALEHDDARAIPEAAIRIQALVAAGVRLIVLPELFCFGRAQLIGRGVELVAAAVGALGAVVGDAHVVTSLPWGGQLCGLVIGAGGVLAAFPHLHASARHAWSTPGSSVATIDLPWGRLGILVGDDAIYPESTRLLALAGASVVAAPLELLEPWESSLGLVERSAENRVHLVAAARPNRAGAGLCTQLPADFTVMTPWQTRRFDGLLSRPTLVRAPDGPGAARTTISPRVAANKVVSHRTDLVASRPWDLIDALTAVGGPHVA